MGENEFSKQKLKEFNTTKSALEEMLKGFLKLKIKTLISNKKTYKKNVTGEGKYIVKEVD